MSQYVVAVRFRRQAMYSTFEPLLQADHAVLNYDPGQLPQIDPEQYEEATLLGLMPVNIICSNADGVQDDWNGVNFAAFVAAIPRVGEIIALQNETWCRVMQVIHRVAETGDTRFLASSANIIAVKIAEEGSFTSTEQRRE